MRPSYFHGGFSLAEVLVAIVIGLFLTAGIVQVFVANKQTYRFNEALARMQENGRLAMELMASDLRMADFWGCAPRDSVTNLNPGGFVTVGLSGTNGSNGAADTITLAGATGAGLRLSGTLATPTANILLDASVTGDNDCTPKFRVGEICGAGDTVLVSDCEKADIFTVTDIGNSSGNFLGHAVALSKLYGGNASVFSARTAEYSIAISKGQPSLGVKENGGNWRPVVEGVQDLQIAYGKDTDGNGAADEYASAAGGGAAWFDNVVSVRVAFLLQSTETGLADSPQQVQFNGQTITCPDRRLCQVMTGTITLRNRIK
jgi:type IV pilus assembly protein PilW